jgi:TRAP-type transport system periplasmic protein
VSREENSKAIEELKAKKMQVGELPAEEVAKLRQMVKPVVEKHAKEADQALLQQLYAEIEKVRRKS